MLKLIGVKLWSRLWSTVPNVLFNYRHEECAVWTSLAMTTGELKVLNSVSLRLNCRSKVNPVIVAMDLLFEIIEEDKSDKSKFTYLDMMN